MAVSTVRVTNNIHYSEEILKTMKHHLRNLVLVAVAALFLAISFTAVGTLGQNPPMACPNPKTVHIVHAAPGTTATTPFAADFPTGPCSAGIEPNYGGTSQNRCFRDTFTWDIPREMCCQCIQDNANTLTLKLKVLPGMGESNDAWAIYKNGVIPSLGSGKLYSGTTTTGQETTKEIAIRCEWLSNTSRLSFQVQDDSAVISATLNLVGCCVTKN